MNKILTIAVLVGLCVWATWYGAKIWFSLNDVEMSFHGNFAIVIGVVMTLLVGCGLMILLFYSARYGHDDGAYNLMDDNDHQSPKDPKQ